MVKYVLEENKMLKQKLELCNKLVDAFQENSDLKTQLNFNKTVVTSPAKPETFFDDIEVNLFDFLKEKGPEMNYF